MMEGVELKPVCVLQTPKNDSGMGVTNSVHVLGRTQKDVLGAHWSRNNESGNMYSFVFYLAPCMQNKRIDVGRRGI